jgi:Flp pilus assembly pilin Flp
MGANTKRWFQRRRGATLAEYMVLLLLTSLVVIVGIRLFGATVQDKYSGALDEIGYQQGSSDAPREGGAHRGDKGAGSPDGAHGGPVQGPRNNRGADSTVAEQGASVSRNSSLGGFNYFTLLLFGALIGVLGYVVFAKKEG